MTTLIEFLLARIKDDEARLNSLRLRDGSWGDGFRRWAIPQMLTECEAKRQMVEIHPVYGDDIGDGGQHDCPGEWPGYQDAPDEPCPTLRLLALPYADHPDYRKEWKP